jgi:hypothetical protein
MLDPFYRRRRVLLGLRSFAALAFLAVCAFAAPLFLLGMKTSGAVRFVPEVIFGTNDLPPSPFFLKRPFLSLGCFRSVNVAIRSSTFL